MPDSLYRQHFPTVRGALRTDRDAPPAQVAFDAPAGKKKALAALQDLSLVSSYQGSIDQLLFTLPRWVFDDSGDQCFRSLLEALPAGTRFVVATHGSVADKVRALFAETGHSNHLELVNIPEHVNFTDWAEDGYVSAHGAGNGAVRLLEPFTFRRYGDSLVADYLEDNTVIRATQAPVIFQGGNCLVGDTFWLMGEDYFSETLDLVSDQNSPMNLPESDTPTETQVEKIYADALDAKRTLIRVGALGPMPRADQKFAVREGNEFFLDYAYRGVGQQQPIFHIDMFMTLVGREKPGRPFRILVGSPAMAEALTGAPVSMYAMQNIFDEIAWKLAASGFEVIRNPLAHTFATGSSLTLAELEAQGEDPELVAEFVALGAVPGSSIVPRDWYHASHNNCLVQVSAKKGNQVYLPSFGTVQPHLASVDAAMRDLWTGLGFQVHVLTDFNAYARRLGVVHCIKKYLARGA